MRHRLPLLILTALLCASLADAKMRRPAPPPPLAPKPAANPAMPPPTPAWPFRVAPAETDATKAPEPGGLGIVLGEKAGDIAVQQVIPGGPAQKAGLRVGDVLESTDALPKLHGMKLQDVTPQIRGLPGTVCHVVARRGSETLKIEMTRVALKRLFPLPSKDVLTVRTGAALLTTGATHQLAVTWLATQKAHDEQPTIVTARVTSAPLDKPLVAGAGEPREVKMTGESATLTVEDWRLDLRLLPDGETVAVTASNLPVVDAGTDGNAWQQPWADPVAPRAPPKLAVKWRGAASVRLRAMSNGKPVANQRIALRIAQEKKELESVTAATDAEGRFHVQLDGGPFTVRGLTMATPGGLRDAFFSNQLAHEVVGVAKGDETELVLPLDAKAPGTGNVDDWKTDEHVGHGLPTLDVKRWFGEKPADPKDLKGQVLLVYLWATWCGPCRMTAPMIAELNVRMKDTGLRIVEASVDRDEHALEAFHGEFLPGAPAVAWLGPDGLETLEVSSIPTFIVLDQTGTIRGFRRGGGWALEPLEAWLRQLLAETKKP
jgi:thiol-disulfide isomerase/thioredoxin